jgi:hypothetical protein
LIEKYGSFTTLPSSSLQRLTSTSSTNPVPLLDSPPASPASIVSPFVTASGTQPIPIPQTVPARSGDDFPVTPLTGRFPQESPFAQVGHLEHSTKRETVSRDGRQGERLPLRLKLPAGPPTQSHSFNSVFAMSQSSGSVSQQASQKPQSFFPGNLPRFHPAIYQSPNDAHNTTQPPLSSSQKPHTYRTSSGARDALRQYRELVTGITLPRNASAAPSKPSKPRLDPLGSPGPVTPLTLEEADEYMAAGTANASESNGNAGPAPERVERMTIGDRVLLQENRDLPGR